MVERINFICSVEGCGKDAHAKGWCRSHWARMHNYGRLEKVKGNIKGNCTVEGCNNPIKGKGLCANHYQMMRVYGRTDKIQKESKTVHPFYHLWFERKQKKQLGESWLDFWVFAAAVTPKPDGHFFLVRKDENQPYSDLNFEWIEKLKIGDAETDKEFWARKWESRRIRNPDEEYERNLQRNFGMPLSTYLVKLEAQNFVCEICKEPETRMRKDKAARLSVDHCHTTGKIRDLLCNRCNTTLGRINEDLNLLDKMRAYLIKHL